MQPLDLNLASRPFKNNTLLWVGYGTAVIVLVLFTVWNVNSFTRHRTLVVDLDREVSTIEQQFRDLETRRIQAQQAIRGYDVEALAIQAAKADDVIRWKAFSWTRLFNQLEKIQPYDVRMTSVHPIFRSRAERGLLKDEEQEHGLPVSVEGVAKDHAAFLDLERALLADGHFDRVEPSRTAREKVSGHTIFDLRFSYDPEAVPRDEVLQAVERAEGETEPESVTDPGPAAEAPDEQVAAVEPPAPAARAPATGPREIGRRAIEPEATAEVPAEARDVAETGFGQLGVPVEAEAADVSSTAAARSAAEQAQQPQEQEEVFPENPPAQEPPPRVRRPTARQPTPQRPRAKPRSTSRGDMGGR